MGKLLVKEKDLVVPGEVLAEGLDYVPSTGTFREGNNVLASLLGLVSIEGRAMKIIPISGRYLPKVGDTVIGQIVDVMMSGWRVDINSAYTAVISLRDGTTSYIPKGADLTKYYDLGDYIVAKVTNVTTQRLVDLTMKGPGLRKLSGGTIIKINHTKVPRVIGRNGSMVKLLKDLGKCKISVGQNGLVWVQGEPKNEVVVITAIKKIEENSLTSGLTEGIREYITSSLKGLGSDDSKGKKPSEKKNNN